MGGDVADLDNDGFPEIFVSDMLPGTEQRLKTVTDFIEWEKYREEIRLGYHRKFVRNTLHYNNADGTFSEIGRYAGVEATDWSWGGLIADFNLDGLRDVFRAERVLWERRRQGLCRNRDAQRGRAPGWKPRLSATHRDDARRATLQLPVRKHRRVAIRE